MIGTASAASLGLYVLLALRYLLGPSLADPRGSWATMVQPTWQSAFLHLLLYLGLILAYLVALRLLAPSPQGSRGNRQGVVLLIVVTWFACSVALLFGAPGGESHDIFDYLFRGRLMTEYGANPLVDVPNDFGPSAPYARYLAWYKNVDTYGPVWEAASAAVAGAVRETGTVLGWWSPSSPTCPGSDASCRLLASYITGYRLLAIGMTGLAGWVIASTVARRRPELVPRALATWLWNPLTVVASALGAHNDAAMLVLLLLGWWLLQRGRPFWALMALVLAAHVKLTALIWIPVCALWIAGRYGWRQALKIWLGSAVGGLALSWLAYAPFGGWQSLPRMLNERSAYLANSSSAILKYLLVQLRGWTFTSASQFSIQLSTGLFGAGALLIALVACGLLAKRWRAPVLTAEQADHALWRGLAATSLLYLLVGSYWFQHWYVLWLVAPAALLPNSRITRSIVPWLAFGALTSNMIMNFVLTRTADGRSPLSPLQEQALSFGLIWGPALLAAIIRQLSGQWRALNAPLSTA